MARCPICGGSQLSEWPHDHGPASGGVLYEVVGGELVRVDGTRQPNPDPLRPDDDPRLPRHEPTPARSFLGCRWWVALAVTIAIALLLVAAPRGTQNAALNDGRVAPARASASLGAPHDSVAGATPDGRSALAGKRLAPTVTSSPRAAQPGGAPQPAVPSGASEPIASMPAPTPTSEPTGAVSGSYTATATWCAPTPTQCQSWGGTAKLAAVKSFTWGDEPYLVRVWRGEASVVVRVVSFCACRGIDRAIDLSPSAFRQLAPLGRGRVNVVVEDLSGVVVPATEVME